MSFSLSARREVFYLFRWEGLSSELQEIQREMDEIQRLQALLSHARARELLGGEPADSSGQLTLTRVNTGRERKTR